MIGQTLGSYTLERELGRGGMGAVYAAVHGLLGRRAAVKVLLAELSRDQSIVQRFFNEARSATAIKHPSIVEIYDFGFAPDGAAYIVMELMEGESLAARLRGLGKLPVGNALVIARQVATALAAAHRAGIIHRDLKPDNVFLVPDPEVAGGERVKLLDFGIAKLVIEQVGAAKTTTGAIMGTPHYMSPEQCEGSRAVDHRSDLYSLGVMLFQMITGRLPFVGEGVGGIIGAHLFVEPPALRSLAPEAPAEVEAFVARLLAKAPDDRPQSADEVAIALGRLGAASGNLVAPVVITRPPADVGNMATLPTPSPTADTAPPTRDTAPPTRDTAPPTRDTAPPTRDTAPATSTTLSAAAHDQLDDAPPPRSRRGLVLAIGGLAVAGTLVAIAIAATSGGGKAPAAAPDAAPIAIADAGPPVDALAPAAAALAAMQAALDAKDWPQIRARLDEVYDATRDGDPERARADAIMAQARPLALAAAMEEIAVLNARHECGKSRELAGEHAADWDSDATHALVQTVTRAAKQCKAAPSTGGHAGSGSGSTQPPVIDPTPPVIEPTPPTDAEIVAGIKKAFREGQFLVASLHCAALPRAVVRKQLAFECSLAECRTGTVALARDLILHLPEPRARAIRRACAANGVELPGLPTVPGEPGDPLPAPVEPVPDPGQSPGLPPTVPDKGSSPGN